MKLDVNVFVIEEPGFGPSNGGLLSKAASEIKDHGEGIVPNQTNANEFITMEFRVKSRHSDGEQCAVIQTIEQLTSHSVVPGEDNEDIFNNPGIHMILFNKVDDVQALEDLVLGIRDPVPGVDCSPDMPDSMSDDEQEDVEYGHKLGCDETDNYGRPYQPPMMIFLLAVGANDDNISATLELLDSRLANCIALDCLTLDKHWDLNEVKQLLLQNYRAFLGSSERERVSAVITNNQYRIIARSMRGKKPDGRVNKGRGRRICRSSELPNFYSPARRPPLQGDTQFPPPTLCIV